MIPPKNNKARILGKDCRPGIHAFVSNICDKIATESDIALFGRGVQGKNRLKYAALLLGAEWERQ